MAGHVTPATRSRSRVSRVVRRRRGRAGSAAPSPRPAPGPVDRDRGQRQQRVPGGGVGHAAGGRSPCEAWKLRRFAVVCEPNMPVDFLRGDRARQVLLQPQHLVAFASPAAVPGRRVFGRHARQRRERRRQRAPAARRRLLPVPPGRGRSRRSRRPPRGSAAGRPTLTGRRRSARAGRSGGRRCGWRCRCWRRPCRPSVPMAFQYICGALNCAPPGPRKTE